MLKTKVLLAIKSDLERNAPIYGQWTVSSKISYHCDSIDERRNHITVVLIPPETIQDIQEQLNPNADFDEVESGHYVVYVRTATELCFMDPGGMSPATLGLPSANKHVPFPVQLPTSYSCGPHIILYALIIFRGTTHDSLMRIMRRNQQKPDKPYFTIENRDMAVMKCCKSIPEVYKWFDFEGFRNSDTTDELFYQLNERLLRGAPRT